MGLKTPEFFIHKRRINREGVNIRGSNGDDKRTSINGEIITCIGNCYVES